MSYNTLAVVVAIIVPTALLVYKYLLLKIYRWFRQFTVVKQAELDALHKLVRDLQRDNAMLVRNMRIKTESHGQLKMDTVIEQPAYFYSTPWCFEGRNWVQRWRWDDWAQAKQGKRLVRRGKHYVWVDEPEKGDILIEPDRYFTWVPEEQVYKNGKHNGNGRTVPNGRKLRRAVRSG